jgi:phosphate-selective porin OprO/OprP
MLFGLAGSAAALPSENHQPDTTSPQQHAPAGGTDETLIKTYFKDGLRFETADKAFQMKFGGRILFDAAFIGTNNNYENTFGEEEDAAGFRTTRISTEGSFNEAIDFKWQYDFSGGVNNKFKDVYIGFRNTPAGNLRVGQFREPFSLEQLTSISHITFMERSVADKLVPARNVGIMLFDTNPAKTFNWAVGIFRDDGSDTGNSTGDGEYAVTGRICGTPIKEDATHLLHLGGSYSVRSLPGDTYAVSTKGESNLTQQTIAAVSIAAGDANVGGLEAAWVNGPLSLQSEYTMSTVDPDIGSDLNYSGYYVYVSYFLTGESRKYQDTTGAFGRVKVIKPYATDGGRGACELAFRVSGLDLDDGSSPGGDVNSYTTGVNWYLNDFTRVMINWVHESADTSSAGDATADILQFRLQLDF